MSYISKIDFFRCIDCHQIIPWTPYDFAPEYKHNSDKDQFEEIAANDRKEFIDKHKNHRREVLKILQVISNFPYKEPIRIDYLIATNGQKKFLIKRFRNDINEPMQYVLIDKQIVFKKDPEISIQKENIRKKIIEEKKDIPIQDWEISSFLVSLEDIACTNTDLFKEKDIVPDNDHPLASWAKFSKKLIDVLLISCEEIFLNEQKLEFIMQFIEKHNEIGDVLAVKMKKTFELKNSS